MKSALSVLLCLGMLATPALAAADLEASLPPWAGEAYDRLEEAGALPYGVYDYGASAGTVIQRGDFVQMLVLSVEAVVPEETLNTVPLVGADYFADTSAAPGYILKAAAWGIAEGRIGDDGLRYGDFGNGLSRQEAAKMVCSALDFFTWKVALVPHAGPAAEYVDEDAIADWAAPFTGQIAAYQLMVGDQNGNFDPQGRLFWDSALVLADRTLTLMEEAAANALSPQSGLPLKSELDWSQALRMPDYQVSKPLTGYAMGYYAIDNGDGTLSALVVPPTLLEYDEGPEFIEVPPTEFYVERYDADGGLADSKSLPMELPIWGGFLDGGDYFYLAFGQSNWEQSDGKEVYRIVQYDRDWNRVTAASVKGGESYTTLPYEATLSRMDLSADGKTLVLHAARERYASGDGVHHQSNVTITVNTDGMQATSVSGEFPDNHVSHSFGQFVRFDGAKPITVDHGDAYPRSFVLQDGSRKVDLLELYGPAGENKTHAIGSGFEVTDSGYLFLGCSARQDEHTHSTTPWNVFLTYTGKGGGSTDFTWLTQGESDIRCARLVKLSDTEFLAMWGADGDVRYQRLDEKGKPVGSEGVLENASMPTTQPLVSGGAVRWIGVLAPRTADDMAQAAVFTLEP